MKIKKMQRKTLEDLKKLWYLAANNNERKEKAIQAIIQMEKESLQGWTINDLREHILQLNILGLKAFKDMFKDELWQVMLDYFCIDTDADLDDLDIYEPFIEWLKNDVGLILLDY